MAVCAPLTPRQDDLLTFLRSCDTCPSYEEIKAGLGLSSKSGAHQLVGGLIQRGFLRRGAGGARNLEIVEPNPLADVSTAALIAELEGRGYRVAVCGQCQAVPGDERAHRCTRVDCGLSDRFHEGCNAA